MTQLILPPWSFSLLEKFANCPRSAFHYYVLKERPPKTAAQDQGNQADKAFESRVKDGTPLPAEYASFEPTMAALANMAQQDCQLYTQLKLGITREFRPCKFFDDKVWGRSSPDFVAVKRRTQGVANTAVLVDYKMGKNNETKPWYDGGLQRKINTLMLWKMLPGLDQVTGFNIYLSLGQIGKPMVFTRKEEPLLWREVLTKVLAVEEAFRKGSWPEKEGPLCKYCPVKTCNFNCS